MEKELFSPMEIDALGEMINISLGSSATAVSNLLDHRVDITTPKVSVVNVKDFALGNLEPAMGVEIKYVEGLDGSNLMLLRRDDIKVIVDILMGMESSDEEFELNDLTISAVCEVMNQMMGAASTAMSDFLGFPVNISTPIPFELDDMEKFKEEHLPQGAETIVIVRFSLKIEGALESEFMHVMSVALAKQLLRGLGLSFDEPEEVAAPAPAPAAEPAPAPAAEEASNSRMMSQEEIEAMLAGGAAAEEPAPAAEEASNSRMMSQEEIEAMLAGGAAAEEPAPAAEEASSSRMMSQEEIEAMLAGGAAAEEPAPAPAPAPAPTPTAAPTPPPAPAPTPTPPPAAAQIPPAAMPGMGMPGMPGMPGMAVPPGYMPMYYPYPAPPQAQATAEPKVIETTPVNLPELDVAAKIGKEQAENLDLIMEVPLQVTVEIGRTRRKVQDILEFSKGSLVVLDKLAGDQVDLFVNGKCIAKGDVVVIDDNFGVRITEIIKTPLVEGSSPES